MIRSPSKIDYTNYFLGKVHDQNLDAYHLTIDYKSASSPKAAANCLRRFLPIFFSQTISRNWLRYRDQFELHGFIEPPGAAYHHHCILLIQHDLSKRFQRKCLNLMPDDDLRGYLKTDFQRSFADSYKLPLFMAGRVVLACRNSYYVRSVCVQPLYERVDIIKCSQYAAKKYDFLSKTNPDDSHFVFPL